MTDTNTAPTAQGTLVDVRDVVAANIAKAIGLQATEAEVKAIKQHVEDELTALQQHFHGILQDVQHAYQADLIDVKSAYSFARDHVVALSASAAFVFALGVLVGHVL